VFEWSLQDARSTAPDSARSTVAAAEGRAGESLVLHDLLGGDGGFSLDQWLGHGSGALPASALAPDAGAAPTGAAADTRLVIEGIDIHAVLGMPGSAFEHPLMHTQVERLKPLADTV
jgi:hypothetical protein